MIQCVAHYLEAMRDAMKTALIDKKMEEIAAPPEPAMAERADDDDAEIENPDAADSKMEDPGEAQEEEPLEDDIPVEPVDAD